MPEKQFKHNFVTNEESELVIQALMEQLGVDNDAQLMNYALSILRHVLGEVQEGRELGSRDEKGNFCRIVLPPAKRS
jgi:hypothetical protein